MNNTDVIRLSQRINDTFYNGDIYKTKELVDIMDTFSRKPLKTIDDYADFYFSHLYTFKEFSQLVEDERKQVEGMSEEECKAQIGKSILQMPCGWYVQYV